MNKRGIAPIVTNVLLIIVALTLASVVAVYSYNQITKVGESGAKELIQAECPAIYDFRMEGCFDMFQKQVNLDIVNLKANISSAVLAVNSGGETNLIPVDLDTPIAQGGARSIVVDVDSALIDKVQLLPAYQDKNAIVYCEIIPPISLGAC